MRLLQRQIRWLLGVLLCLFALAACDASHKFDSTIPSKPQLDPEILQRDPAIPALPFADNPDPDQCGIPVQWGEDRIAWLNGVYSGELIEPEVYLYDSHLRLSIKGRAPHGSRVEILLYQENPVLDYYLVKTIDLDPSLEGWVPAPFISFTALK